MGPDSNLFSSHRVGDSKKLRSERLARSAPPWSREPVTRVFQGSASHLAYLVACVAFAGMSLAFTAEARAQGAQPDAVTTLEKSLAEEHAALSTADCSTACRALASIRRAAEKICALDPDERCVAARAKADDATRRVRDACPDCAIASAPLPTSPPRDRPAAKGGVHAGSDSPSPVSASPPNSPQSESRRGGCAGCTTTAAAPAGDLASVALALVALALVLRRKRSTPPSR